MRNTLIIAFALVSVSGGLARQAELSVKEITERIQHRYEMIDDAIASFDQRVKFGFSSIEQNFAGTMTMKKPNKYRIESEHQTIVTDGVTVWVYLPANKQVIIDKYKENQNSISPEQFVLNLPSAYYVVLLGSVQQGEKKLLQLKLTPKDDRSFVKTVRLWVEPDTWMVRKVTIVDVNETETVYTVNELRLNTNVKDQSFRFEPPPGTDVVDLQN